MTSTTVDTEYKLNEDKTTFTKVYMIVNSQCGLAFENRSVWSTSHGCKWFGVNAIFYQVTSNFSRSTEYPMPTQGEFFPKKSLSGKDEVCSPSNVIIIIITSLKRWED